VHQKDFPAGSHPQKLSFKKATTTDTTTTDAKKTETATTPPLEQPNGATSVITYSAMIAAAITTMVF